MFTLDDLITQRPPLHRHGDGRKASWGASETVLKFIMDHAGPHSKTIETGAGHSTIAFALSGAEHYAVFPEPYLADTVGDFLDDNGIARDKLHLLNGPSQDILPALKEDGFDLVFIDGDHAFPVPFMDWYYLGRRMKPGGLLIIDDTQIWTGHVLKTFLMMEPEWRLIKDCYGASFFRMEEPWSGKWWGKQAYTVIHSSFKPGDENLFTPHIREMLLPVYESDK
ncbi:O-methyltransferase [Desulfolutivibrio sp.]|uniref:O-methyltransferase n=1 Tax=Desulfolutivibrio sp. TaxID=2773296 RepID=UPI002F960F09